MGGGRVLVVGGAGYFGRLLVRDLAASGVTGIIVAGREPARLDAVRARALDAVTAVRVCDLGDEGSLSAALEGVAVAVNAAGPFQGMPICLARLCLARGIAYLDLSDDREFTGRVEAMVRESAPAVAASVFSGCSAVPALTGVLARIAADTFEEITSIDLQIAPGNRLPRAAGTVASLLASVGRPFTVWRGGRWAGVRGWTSPRVFRFPPPVGLRRGWLVDVPAHESFPALFGAARVEFRAGAELGILNQATSVLRWLRERGVVQDVARWTPLCQRAMGLFGFLGTDTGAVGAEVAGRRRGEPFIGRASVVASEAGERIPILPASIMVRRCLAGPVPGGLVAPDRWIGRAELEAECARRGFRLVVDEEPVAGEDDPHG